MILPILLLAVISCKGFLPNNFVHLRPPTPPSHPTTTHPKTLHTSINDNFDATLNGTLSVDYMTSPPTISTLRRIFGTNKNRLWGDLDNKETRRLYHELLPKALLMVEREKGLTLEERAILASTARTAAKSYARSRCNLPGRLTATLYDGFRHYREFGYFSWSGMNWEEVWAK